ncbi:receptor-like protein kinase FERONIA [Quercus lobata]|uniref:receptor-like protein kinase FERONIA n=1 Tax=Quercus lobata TaxID=97700 RepID=UPI0012451374|nr:receptor-like protein kinase FERONIA [Quercus lobata]
MKNHSLLTPIFFIFCPGFIFCHFTVATSTPPYKAVDHIALNCGTSGNSNPPDGRNWTGEIGSKYGPTEQNNKSIFSDAQSHSSVGTVPYTTARLSHFQFTYAFPVAAGPKFVRLYFHSASYSGYEKSKDFFTVKAGSFTLLGNFSTSDSTESKSFFKEFCINVEENQILKLTFIPFSSDYYAFINGIEIVSMPIDLYYSQKGFIKYEWVPEYVAQAPRFYINYSMALEMVYRLNVGGSLIQPKEDTGMFREWSEAIKKYLWSGGTIPRDPSLNPKYSKIPNYTAPDPIYQSAITMGPNMTKNMQSNLTWGLRVDTGFKYLVRLHFC